MPPKRTTGITSVHEARDALGKRLRALRTAAGLSGRTLAESLSWPPSKVSKLENGKQTPTDDDIREWTGATDSEAEAEALLASLHTLCASMVERLELEANAHVLTPVPCRRAGGNRGGPVRH